MRQARGQVEWEAAMEVQVALAGDNTTSMRLTSSGTLLLSPGRDGLIQPRYARPKPKEEEGVTSSVQLGYAFVCGLGFTWRHETIRVSRHCSGGVGHLPLKEPRFVPLSALEAPG